MTRGTHPEIAPLGLRVRAGLINGVLIGSAGVVGLGAAIAEDRWPEVYRRLEPLGRLVARQLHILQGSPWRRVATGLTGAVVLRNRPSPGARMVGIRRADAGTGGPVTVRSAVTQYLINEARAQLLKPVIQRSFKRMFKPGEDAEHSRDPSGAVGCSLAFLTPIVMDLLAVCMTPQRQAAADWVAGIVVVRD